MYPFLTVGSWRFGTYGIMLALGLYCGFFVLSADLRRREISASPFKITLVIGIVGFVVSKLYKIVDTPSVYWAHPILLLSPMGFTFYGAVIGGLGAAFVLAKHYRFSVLTLLDAVSPAAALGYGIGRIGCFLAGDGDYGIPSSLPWAMSFPHGLVPTLERVHPTPIYEFLATAAIALYLWQRGSASIDKHLPEGEVFAEYLLLTGTARFLVEFIRRNPHGWLGLTNAQQVAILSLCAGTLLLFVKLRRKSKVTSLKPL